MKLQSAVAQRITNLLNQSNMTKYALCKKVVISQSSLKRILDGDTNDIKLTTIAKIAEAFDLTLEEFFADPIFNKDDLDID